MGVGRRPITMAMRCCADSRNTHMPHCTAGRHIWQGSAVRPSAASDVHAHHTLSEAKKHTWQRKR